MKTLKQISVVLPLLTVFLIISGVLSLVFPRNIAAPEIQTVDSITLQSAGDSYDLYTIKVEPKKEYTITFRAAGSGSVQLCTDLYAGDLFDSAENDHYVPVDGSVVNVAYAPYDTSEETFIRFILTGDGSAEVTEISVEKTGDTLSDGASVIIGICSLAVGVVLFVLYLVVRRKTAGIELEEKNGITFITNLRGVAAIFVVVTHLLVFYVSDVPSIFPWLLPKAGGSFANDTTRVEDILLQLMEKSGVNFGAFGVSIFFLITGFCMMITLSRTKTITVKEFLAKKVLRLYPVYIVGFLAGVALSLIYASAAGTTFDYSVGHCIMQMTLFGRLFGFSTIDGLVWTLEVQVIFYLLAYILYRAKLINKPYHILCTVFLMFILKFVFANISQNVFIVLSDMITYLLVMFVGVCLYYYYSGKWSAGEALGLAVLIFASATVGNIAPVSYFAGLLLFTTLMFFEKNAEKTGVSKLMGFLSAISYPLYASHALISYNLLSVLERKGVYPTSASLIVFTVDIVVAILLHYIVEKPFEKVIARISARDNTSQ